MIFFWAALYPLAYAIAGFLEKVLHLPQWILSGVIAAYAVLLILWIVKTGRAHTVWLGKPNRLKFRELLQLLPLLILPAYHLLTAQACALSLSVVVLMLSVCVTEEVFFRGYLLRYFLKVGRISGILLSSVVFALCHSINLLHQPNMAYIIAQIVCAFILGICYGAVTVQYETILPALFAHFLTNITGLSGTILESGQAALAFWICIASYFCYGYWLCNKLR